ncbi:diaminopimelate epimerase [uncultured Campylobacter sp.]|uniref:diaminopimelate epimerase n=1 Tax=uncultured Campylobacter sp. TaxID=218934 RepID=UPI00260AB974|nr:diaminopimelate epimerase [uncultured Campylobacter sp.]
MKISKYNASGKDFVIFTDSVKEDRSKLARELCDRREGVGADGLIVVLPKFNGIDGINFEWEIYNSDGSAADMCGNGSRAVCMYAYENFLAGKSMKFLSSAGVIDGEIFGIFGGNLNGGMQGELRNVSFGEIFNLRDNAHALVANVEVMLTQPKRLGESFDEAGRTWYFYNTGAPHLVTFTEDLIEFDVALARELGEKYNANVNYALVQKRVANMILKVRTYERVTEAETLACSTGMAACFIAGVENMGLAADMRVVPASGEMLNLRLANNGKIYFRGDVRHTFNGEFIGYVE